MELILQGHDYKYAVEQMLLTLYPEERPVYPDAPGGTDGAVVTLRRGARFIRMIMMGVMALLLIRLAVDYL